MSEHLESAGTSSPPFPERLGRYRLLRCVSTGGMARVYEGRRESLAGVAPKVAIKVILPEHANDQKFQQLFVNEARIGSQLQHQNVVQIQDFDRQGDCYYLVMEYVEGLTFRRAISHCKRSGLHIPLAVIAELGRQMCEGLHYAHTVRAEDGGPLHLVHRDIKPSNLILNPQGVVKILDFGISKALIASESRGTVKGTWGYMSPEQADGGEVTGRADQYGVAAVLYELAMLQPLFPEKEPRILRTLMVQDEGARRANRLTGPYGPLAPVLVRALQRDAYGRYPTAMAMAQDLARLVPDQVLVREQVLQFQSSILALDKLRKERRGRDVAAVVMPGSNRGALPSAQAVSLQQELRSDATGAEEISDIHENLSPSNLPSLANTPAAGHGGGGPHIPIHNGPLPTLRPVYNSSLAVQGTYDPRATAGMPVTVGNAWRPLSPDELAGPGGDEGDDDMLSTWVLFGVMMTISAAVLLFVGYRLYTERYGAAGQAEVVQDPVVAPVDGAAASGGAGGQGAGGQGAGGQGAGGQGAGGQGAGGQGAAGPGAGGQGAGVQGAGQSGVDAPGGDPGGSAQVSSGREGRRTGREGRQGDEGSGGDDFDPRVGGSGSSGSPTLSAPDPGSAGGDAGQPAAVETGGLNVSSSAFGARLYVGGDMQSRTGVTVKAGTHQIHLVSPEGQRSPPKVVEVPPGRTVSWYYDWDAGTWSQD